MHFYQKEVPDQVGDDITWMYYTGFCKKVFCFVATYCIRRYKRQNDYFFSALSRRMQYVATNRPVFLYNTNLLHAQRHVIPSEVEGPKYNTLAIKHLPILIPMPTSQTPNPRFFQAGSSLAADIPSYVKRKADQELYQHLRQGDFAYVLTARQMGQIKPKSQNHRPTYPK